MKALPVPHYRWTVAPSGFYSVGFINSWGEYALIDSGMTASQEAGKTYALGLIERHKQKRREVAAGKTLMGTVPA